MCNFNWGKGKPMKALGKCKYCSAPLFDRLEIVTEICMNCYATSKEIEEECGALWQDYMDEKYETVRSNQ